MKSTLGISLITAGLATIITAKVVEKVLTEEFDERLQRELSASVDYLVETEKAEPTEEYEEERRIIGGKIDLVKPSLDEVVNKHQKVRYDQIVKAETYKEDSGETEVVETPVIVEPAATLDIFPISQQEYLDDEAGFMQSTLNYFTDGVVTDEDGDVVNAHVDMIGPDIPPFGALSGEDHVVYLRNTKTRREYEVIREDASYSDVHADPADAT